MEARCKLITEVKQAFLNYFHAWALQYTYT